MLRIRRGILRPRWGGWRCSERRRKLMGCGWIPGFVTGDTVSIHYDAMLAKLICHGSTREVALRRMQQALAECAVAGVVSNLDLLGRIVGHPVFARGDRYGLYCS